MNKDVSMIKIRSIGLVFLLLMIIGVNVICTQFIAGRLAYHPALGETLFGTVYSPFSWFDWFFKFHTYAPATYNYAVLIFFGGVALSFAIFTIGIGFKTRSSRRNEGSHGTASFATYEQVKNTGLVKNGAGVYCGGYYDEKSGRTLYLRHNGPEHIAVFAPTRSGKGVGLVVPTLLSWAESVFVLDIKGENFAMTAGWRKKHANNIVLRFDPAEESGSCSWNPLEEIRFGTRHQIGDAQNIALMVIDTDGKGLFDHWRSAAHELLVGVIVHALYRARAVGRQPCIRDCAYMLSGVGDFASPDLENEIDDGDLRPLAGLFREMESLILAEDDTAAHEAQLTIRAAGRRFGETSSKELTSIISTAHNALALYRDPIVGENTSRSDFKIADLMDHERPVSLYFITTPENLSRMKPLARLLLTRMVVSLAGKMEFDAGRSKTMHKYRLLMMLDEFPSLGKLDVFENALAYIAGYGIKAYIIAQDVQQLYKAYGNNESIVSNCHVRLAFAPNKQETADWLSKMTGQTTVIKEQISTSGKRFDMVLGQASRSYQESARPLMTPNEIQRLPAMHTTIDAETPGEMLIFVAGQNVIKGRQTPYFLDPTFNQRSKIPPPKESDVVRATATDPNFALS